MMTSPKIGFPVARLRFPVGGSGKYSAPHFHASLGAPRAGEELFWK